jgi:lysozyme
MTSRRQVSRAGLELIKTFEGCRPRSAQLPDGRWVIGYGHTKTARPGVEIGEDDAEALLIYDLLGVTKAVTELVYAPLSQNQFDALCAFAFNIGVEAFRTSDVLRRVNAGEPLQAACAMDLWRRAELDGAPVVIDALVRRRAVEKALFLTPTDGFAASPTPLLQPRLDDDICGAVPRETPATVVAAEDGDKLVAERISAEAQASLDLAAFPGAEAEPTQTEEAPAEVSPFESAAADFEADATLAEPAEEALADAPPPIPARVQVDPAFDAMTSADEAPAEDREAAPAVEELRSAVSPTLLWAGLALFGLVVFAAGIFWGFSPDTADEGDIAPAAIGWGLGLIGILCVATAVYFLLDRLSGDDEDEL